MQLWKLAALSAVCVPLAACAGVYDASAVPSAQAAMQYAKDQCVARLNSGEYKTTLESVNCALEADRAFAVAVKLKKMDLYNAYAGRMRMVAMDRDAGRITREEAQMRGGAVWKDYIGGIDQAAQIDAEQRARMAAALSAMGQSMQREADRQAYIQAHQQQPLNCTSTGFGNTVTTHCN